MRFTAMVLALLIVAQLPAYADEEKVFDKPLFLMAYDKTCKAWYGKMHPLVQQLRKEFSDKFDFGELDVTAEVSATTLKEAEQMGVAKHLPALQKETPCVIGYGRKRSNTVHKILGVKTEQTYRDMIAKMLNKQQ